MRSAITQASTGTQGAVFHVYDELNLGRYPRRFTVEAGKMISDAWAAVADDAGKYSLWVLGPAGYHRHFRGDLGALAEGPNPEVRVCYDHDGNSIYLTIMNMGTAPATVTVTPAPLTITAPSATPGSAAPGACRSSTP